MERTYISESKDLTGKKVKICGWVQTRRDHGKLIFLDLRDKTGIVQVVFGEKAKEIGTEFVLEVEGEVKKRPENLINEKIETGKIEIKAEKFKIVSESKPQPFDIDVPDLSVSLPTLLDFRPLTLRHPKVKAIFTLQEAIIQSFRKTLNDLKFTEIQVPTIVPTATEGGSEVFKIDYYGKKAYLAQSPQLYKQILVGVYEKVFTLAHAYRAEPSETTRHLSEYLSFDAEMGFIESWEDLMDVVEKIFVNLNSDLKEKCEKELKLFEVSLPKIPNPIPKLKLADAQEIIFKRSGRDNRKEPDLTPDDEKEICKWAKEERESDLVFITHFPAKKRPFYTYPDPKDKNSTLSFDLLGLGVEWVTGGQRINDYEDLIANIKKWGNKSEDFEFYLEAFKYGMPEEGGFAIGVERVTAYILGLKNIKEASLFPRDMGRIDLPLTKISSR